MSFFNLGPKSSMKRSTKLGYGLGHVLNDLCASMWFTYLLVYLQYVLGLDKALAGFLLLLGQVADGISTPIVGIQSDRGCVNSHCCVYGKRKTWHLIGTVCVLFSFPFIFITCSHCYELYPDLYVTLIAVMICIFQFGWASTQVSHLALIPDLTPLEAERDELNIIRYFFDVNSDVLVYVITWIVFKQEAKFGGETIDASDAHKFTTVTVCVLVIGAIFSILFHIITPEPIQINSPRPSPPPSLTSSTSTHSKDIPVGGSATKTGVATAATTQREVEQGIGSMTGSREELLTGNAEELSINVEMAWRDWLVEPQFYKVSLLYTCARLVANLANIFMPIYLQETLHTREELIALIPLVMSLSGVAATIGLRFLRKGVGKKASYVVAVFIGLAASTGSSLPILPEWGVYCVAILWGLSGSLMIILSLAFTADLIGFCTDSSAFVYGSMSFWDKLVNGLAVFLIQELTKSECIGNNCATYYRRVMSVGILIPLLAGLVGICTIATVKLGKTRKLRKALREAQESSGASLSSDSSEILLASAPPVDYGSLMKS
ncbi:major facilitator superfamily domain-containing protein 12-like [Oratosquilla oratoria]|uniref:major facilitator superfamily domain-containing protein 12-like n=1 Tax=Oratosquilla oratoria TaxID=337810 RepID=UPI003F76B885